MRNRATNHIIKITNSQINGIVDRKKSIDNEVQCEKAMTELRKIYWYEKLLLIAIPMLTQSATTFELVESLSLQLKYVREHVNMLETNFPSITKLTEQKNIIIPRRKRSMHKVIQ